MSKKGCGCICTLVCLWPQNYAAFFYVLSSGALAYLLIHCYTKDSFLWHLFSLSSPLGVGSKTNGNRERRRLCQILLEQNSMNSWREIEDKKKGGRARELEESKKSRSTLQRIWLESWGNILNSNLSIKYMVLDFLGGQNITSKKDEKIFVINQFLWILRQYFSVPDGTPLSCGQITAVGQERI